MSRREFIVGAAADGGDDPAAWEHQEVLNAAVGSVHILLPRRALARAEVASEGKTELA